MAVRFSDNSRVYFQLDWFTIIFRNCSIDDCIDYLNLHDIVTDDRVDAWSKWEFQSYGYDKTCKFSINTIQIELRPNELQLVAVEQGRQFDDVNGYDLFSWKLPFIRFQFTGQGLEFLRSCKYDVDNKFLQIHNIPVIEGSFGLDVTRCDFAFDFVNIDTDFLDKAIDFCISRRNPDSLHIPCGDLRAGKKCGVKLCDQQCMYIGTGRSDLLLRVYDKKLEYKNNRKCIEDAPFYDDLGGEPINQWIRVELESSTRSIGSILDTCSGSKSIFRFISEKFAFRNDWPLDSGYCDFWLELFDYDQISGIILNRKSVQYVPVLDRADTFIENNGLSSILVSMAGHGKTFVIDFVESFFVKLQKSKVLSDRKRFLTILNKILDIYGVLPDTMYIDEEGIYRFK